MKLKLIVLLSILTTQLTLTSCSTLYFHNGETSQDQTHESSEWHHNGVLDLVEFSPPVDLADRCGGKGWSTIKVEQTFIH